MQYGNTDIHLSRKEREALIRRYMGKTVDIKEVRLCDISEEAKDRFIARFPDAPWKFVKCATNEEKLAAAEGEIVLLRKEAGLWQEEPFQEGEA